VTSPIPLESIMPCFQGVIPSPFATCAADGTPNITYMSIVHYVDSGRVALSSQFFNKTRANLDANPYAQVRVIDPVSIQEYAIDLEYLHMETEGPTFEAMKANLEAIASQTGHEVFRLRGVDIHRALRCAPAKQSMAAPSRQPERDVVARIDEFTRRLTRVQEYDDAARIGLEALDDLFDVTQSILLVADDGGARLFAIAENGYPTSGAGGEVPFGVGVVGIAAERRQLVCVPNLARSRIMQSAAGSADARAASGTDIALPGLQDAQSVAAIPLLTRDRLLGVLYLESTTVGRFGPHNERLLRVLASHLAAVLGGFDGDHDSDDNEAALDDAVGAPPPRHTRECAAVTYYQADDSVFVDETYVIKGVPGRILWRLLCEHTAHGRETFTNRELRLDERLGLPVGNDNLEARLLVLRKRLAAAEIGIRLDRVGRGRLQFELDGPVLLNEVPTSGPMRVAHAPDRAR
jgi:adenylate cyclase